MRHATIVVVSAIVLLTFLYFVYWSFINSSVDNSNQVLKSFDDAFDHSEYKCEYFNKIHGPAFWKQVDYELFPIPQAAVRGAVSVVVESHVIRVNNVNLHYKESKALKPDHGAISVLFLHGAAFSSDTWESLGTLNLVSAFGFRAVAIDLPGFGKSPRAAVPEKGKFLFDVIAALKLQKIVVISPSMSGVFSLPYVIEYWESVSGFVPVSPVIPAALSTNSCESKKFSEEIIMDKTCKDWTKYTRSSNDESFSCVQIPVMIIHGQHDRSENSARMCHFPWGKGVVIPDGQHAAYMTKPPLWHKLLYNFLSLVNKTQTCR